MHIDILTIFPPMCRAPLDESIVRRAQESGLVKIEVHDLREFATDKHRRVDDIPYGGGQGMVMKPEPIFAAVRHFRRDNTQVILMTPQGRRFNQPIAQHYADLGGHLILLCGHYEGIDHRVTEALVDDEISIGDYILSNGAIAAVVCFGLWESGALPDLMSWGSTLVAHKLGYGGEVHVPRGFWGSLMAGYGMDSAARTVWLWWDKRVGENAK